MLLCGNVSFNVWVMYHLIPHFCLRYTSISVSVSVNERPASCPPRYVCVREANEVSLLWLCDVWGTGAALKLR